jgi:hypothetical protein
MEEHIPPIAFADGDGNNYILTTSSPLLVNQTGQAFNLAAAYLVAPAPVSNSKTITMSWSGAVAGSAIWIAEFQGNATSLVFEADAPATNQGPGTTINTPTVTTTNNGDAILNCASWAGSAAVAGSWTEINGFYYNGNAGASYNIQSTAGTIGPDYTQTSASWAGLTAAFKPAGGAAPSCKGKLTLLGVGC